MKSQLALISVFAAFSQLAAEEVLSTRPVVISPKRIDTETKVSGKPGKKPQKNERVVQEPEAPAAETSIKDNTVSINEKSVIMRVSFQTGSIQLSRPIRKQLIALGIKPGQKIRITGFGNGTGKNSVRLANLRARVLASFLAEAVGEIDSSLQWSGKPQAAYPEGAVIETLNP